MDGQHAPTHRPLRPLGALVDLVAPPRCGACRRRVDPAAGLAWCSTCGRDLQALESPCGRCAAPGGRDDPACPLDGTAVAATVAAHPWTGTVAAVVRAGKLDGCHAVFPLLGRVVADAVRRDGAAWPPVDVVCPVPASPGRRRRRGFDHALLLARAAADGLGLPCVRLLTLQRDTRDRGAGGGGGADASRGQIGIVEGLHDEARLLATAIAIRRPVDGHAMLVDDVVTTGATVVAAATVLRSAGATRVSVATVARAGRH